MSRSPDAARARVLAWAPFALVTVFGLWLVWPAPIGAMPLSADHTVHLTRIWMYGQALADGRLHDWSPLWFFGTPVGDLYPVLGDLLIVAIRWLSLGQLEWASCYALGFSVVFVAQGWAMLRVGRMLELGPIVGLVAALLVLADPGAYREGGWIYSVDYGVWPQALANLLLWLGVAELASACGETASAAPRRIGLAALWLGGAILAHPIALPSLAIGVVVLAACLARRATFTRDLIRQGLAIALAVGVAAWWLFPMLAHRGWMASYGWLWMPLSRMARWASDGQWTQNMPTPVGIAVGLGIAIAVVRGSSRTRFVVAFALLQWLLASTEAFWWFRLDHFGDGFAHIQYQRFLIAAKPGLFLAAAIPVAMLARASHKWLRERPSEPLNRAKGALAAASAGGIALWMALGQGAGMAKLEVGQVSLERKPDAAGFEADYQEFLAWAHEQWERRDAFYRFAFRSGRNLHWFMDAPVSTGIAAYKLGFTPGDNFVHKPESGRREILDALRVRYIVSTGTSGSHETASFGPIVVRERPDAVTTPIARIDGPGSIEVIDDDPRDGSIRVTVAGAEDASELVFMIAGYPRWVLRRGGQRIDWYEVPVYGDAPAATQAERRGGELRGGKAGGDDGSEPTLLAAAAQDGAYELTYERWQWFDILGCLISMLALSVCTWLCGRGARSARLERIEQRLGRSFAMTVAVACVVLVVVMGRRWWSAHATERAQAVGWLAADRASTVEEMRASPLKTDMLIRPAITVVRRRKRPAVAVFPEVRVGAELFGWVALDDDDAKLPRRGSHSIRVAARPTHSGGEWTSLFNQRLRHRPGRVPLRIATKAFAGQVIELRVEVTSEGKSPPRMGFDLDLVAPP